MLISTQRSRKSSCSDNYFRFSINIPRGHLGTLNMYTCDPCRMPNESRAITCWRGERTDYVDHHPPRLCLRGKYCVNGREYDCEAGKYSPVLGIANKSDCKECLPGTCNPIPAQPFCPFSCPPGKYSDEIGAVEDPCLDCEAGTFAMVACSSLRTALLERIVAARGCNCFVLRKMQRQQIL